MSEKKVHADHRKRMRQRFLDTGGAGFSSHELLELLLFGSVPRINTNPTAHKLIDRFGTVENVLSASADELQKVDGIGAASARLINVMGEACRRFRERNTDIFSFSSEEELLSYIISRSEAFTEPVCMLLFISSNLTITGIETFPLSELIGSPAPEKRLSGCMLRNDRERLTAVFVHPDSPPIPSASDYRLTKLIAEISGSVGITMLDSVICGCGKVFSMRSSGAFSFRTRGGLF